MSIRWSSFFQKSSTLTKLIAFSTVVLPVVLGPSFAQEHKPPFTMMKFSIPLAILSLTVSSIVLCTLEQQAVYNLPEDNNDVYPVVTEEEHLGSHLPKHMLCDGCRAVAFQLHLTLEKRHQFNPDQDYRLKEIDLIDILEDTCRPESFFGYGVGLPSKEKSDKEGSATLDKNVLRGPGSRFDGGHVVAKGRMPLRLAELCQGLTDDESDEDSYQTMKHLYETWAKGGRVQHVLIEALCFDKYCTDFAEIWN